jgi:hypothetical protein
LALEAAVEQSCVQFFIVRDNAVGQRFQHAVLRAAFRTPVVGYRGLRNSARRRGSAA